MAMKTQAEHKLYHRVKKQLRGKLVAQYYRLTDGYEDQPDEAQHDYFSGYGKNPSKVLAQAIMELDQEIMEVDLNQEAK